MRAINARLRRLEAAAYRSQLQRGKVLPTRPALRLIVGNAGGGSQPLDTAECKRYVAHANLIEVVLLDGEIGATSPQALEGFIAGVPIAIR